MYTLDLYVGAEWLGYKLRAEEEKFDKEMQKVAWQTALLMNATGNYKKSIKPTDLYTPYEATGTRSKKEIKTKEQLQAELLETFADSTK